MATEYPVISADDPIEGPFKNLNIIIVKEEHHEAILKHIKEYFCRDEPMSKNAGTEEYDNYLLNFVKGGLVQNNGQCLVALDPKTNEVAGCRISKIVTKEIDTHYKGGIKTADDLPEIRKQIHMMYDVLYQPISDPYEMFNVEKLVEYRALSVGDNYRQMGLGFELLLRSLRLAKKSGIKTIRASFSSMYSLRLAKKFGFKVYNEIFFKDYKVNGEVLLKNMDPHTSIAVTIKEL